MAEVLHLQWVVGARQGAEFERLFTLQAVPGVENGTACYVASFSPAI
jgi:hypothetical protein